MHISKTMETVTIVLSVTNVAALLAFVFTVGGVYQRFKDVEQKVKGLPHLEHLVGRIADRLGLKRSPEELPGESGD
jgi:hypothetical protein